MAKSVHEPLFHLVKRTEFKKSYAWLIRVAAFVVSILTCAIVTTILTDENMGFFFRYFFQGVFGTSFNIWVLFHDAAMLLIIALAVTPCFKMKFWNIGGEGQVLMGALGCAVIVNFLGGNASDAGTIILSLIIAIAFGIVWAVIPALFKARWNTNETLLTLMMNYIAVCIVEYFIKSVATTGTGTLTFSQGLFPTIMGNQFIFKIIVVAVLTLLMTVYFRYSKHGYEISVVGESINTAKYIGISTKKVIIRTLVLCGAICGLAGFLIVSATDYSLSSASTVGGKGFTGVLISWLAHFNPIAMALTSFLVVFIDKGASQVGSFARLGSSYPDVMTGIFFFLIIATEFFINYKIVFKHGKHSKRAKTDGGAMGGSDDGAKDASDDGIDTESAPEIAVVQSDSTEQSLLNADTLYAGVPSDLSATGSVLVKEEI